MKVGIASVVITPPIGTVIVGYGNERISEGIRDDLYAKALVFDDGKLKYAIICCDLLALTKTRVDNIRSFVKESTGINRENVMIACTHNHNGPYTWTLDEFAYAGAADERFDMQYVGTLEKHIAGAARAAVRNLVEAKVGVGSGKVMGISVNRTTSSGHPIDPELGVIKIDDDRGKPLAVIVNYACHPVVLGWDNRLLSADYPGVLTHFLEKNANVPALFTNGASGDINAKAHGIPKERASQELYRMGNIMGDEALKVMLDIETNAVKEIKCHTVGVPLQLNLPTREDIMEKLSEKERMLKEALHEKADDKDVHTGKIDSCREEVAAVKNLLKCVEKQITTISTEIQVIKLGDIGLISVPGELYTEIGLKIKKMSPLKHTFVSEVTNDYIGYIPTKEHFDKNNVPSMLGFSPEIVSNIEKSTLEIMNTVFV